MTAKRWFWGLIGVAVLWSYAGNRAATNEIGGSGPHSRLLDLQKSVATAADLLSVPATFVFGGVQRIFAGGLRWSMARPDPNVTVEQLQEQVRQLQAETLQLTGMFKQAEREWLGFSSARRLGLRPEDVQMAHVLGDPPGPAVSILHLDKGSMDGIKVDMEVVAPLEQVTVLGKVMDVGAKECRVRLLTDPLMKVRADILRDAKTPVTVDPVIIEGLGGGEMGCYTLNVQREGNLPEPQKGDYVRIVDPAWKPITHYMIIGQISDVKTRDNQMLRYDIRIKTMRPVSSLATVMIVK